MAKAGVRSGLHRDAAVLGWSHQVARGDGEWGDGEWVAEWPEQVPPHIKTYIHRVGRTARAGRSGSCYSVLVPTEVWHFKQMLKQTSVSLTTLKGGAPLAELLEEMQDQYAEALQQLKVLSADTKWLI